MDDNRPPPPPPTADGLAALAAGLRSAPPSCGPVRLVAVDGHAGSGKSTLARLLAQLLGGAPVVRLDDLASHEAPFGWTGRLTEQILDPLARGETARYELYDWARRGYTGLRELPPSPVVLIEGVGAGRRALRPRLARTGWLELSAGKSWARGRRRDGPKLSGFWDGWERAEREHFAVDPTRPHADFLVRECSVGYEVLPGPARQC